MNVYECVLHGFISEEFVSDNIVNFVESQVVAKISFQVKSVLDWLNPGIITNWLVGYYDRYGVALLSNPDSKKGLIVIDIENKRLIYNPNDEPFFNHRDAVVYIGSDIQQTYVKNNFQETLKEFQSNGYKMFWFSPKYQGDSLVRYKNAKEIWIGEELSIEDLNI